MVLGEEVSTYLCSSADRSYEEKMFPVSGSLVGSQRKLRENAGFLLYLQAILLPIHSGFFS